LGIGRIMPEIKCIVCTRVNGLRIMINITMRQFRDPNFIDTVKNMITRFEVEPDRIELEIIESVVMDESQIVI
jgi:EAL domain-containing protein (putative c-di-GMP-specific phosphodiesterase class I)